MNFRRAEQILIGAVALHSCILGSAMLIAPLRTLSMGVKGSGRLNRHPD